MATQYRCGNERRRQAVAGRTDLNGIDSLEVASDQQTLRVRLLNDLPAAAAQAIGPTNVAITGGVRIQNVATVAVGAAGNVLTVVTTASGDFSTYTLRLVTSPTNPSPPAWDGHAIDPQLAEIAFSFKIDCPGDFDCRVEEECLDPVASAPVIDYLAKDYASFRRLMLDRLAIVMPDWAERNPADVGVALVETLAYAADHLSYFQDAVATEAYLGTARRRVSVRRHARLLDYPMHDGANARTWVHLRVRDDVAQAQLRVVDPLSAVRTRFLTRCSAAAVVPNDEWEGLVAAARPDVFEPLHDQLLTAAQNEIRFYTWGDEACCLPAGATRATLRRRRAGAPDLQLQRGDVLIFEERLGPATGSAADADPQHRHAVRLTEVQTGEDPLFREGSPPAPIAVLEIAWAPADALPFPLCLSTTVGGALIEDVSVARGNVVLADHGRTIEGELLGPIPADAPYRPTLAAGPVTQQGNVAGPDGRLIPFDATAPAVEAFRWDLRAVRPAVELREGGPAGARWLPQRDLLASDRFATEFVVETEDDGRAHLRFGTPPLGRVPTTPPIATYRVGNGRRGNVGADAVAHVVADALADAVVAVCNPLPATRGVEPEAIGQVRLYAPQAFRTQERAVTEADYAAAAERHPEVQKAAATRRWTGSWHTTFLTIDRTRGLPVDATFEATLRRFLERFRLAGHDLEIEGPRFVPLDVALRVCVAPGYFRANVRQALRETFSSGDLPGGGRGFFHPDNFTFGQPIFLSRIVAAAMAVPGVTWVDVVRFQRWGQLPRGERERGSIDFGRLEIARLDNDPSQPENGRIDFAMEGGL